MILVKQLAARFFGGDPVYARRTFGGVHPPLRKEHSLRSRIMSTPIPPQLTIPIGSETEGSASLQVNVGDYVRKYQQLAVFQRFARGCSGVSSHAPSSGVVTAIGNSSTADHGDQQQLCIVLTTDGHDEPQTLTPHHDYASLPGTVIESLIRDAGIIGMGGAGYPTADKIGSRGAVPVDYLIINAAECEPYITADEALLRERASKVVTGAAILKQASKASRCLIAIEDSKKEALAALRKVIADEPTCELVVVPSKYPAGSERQLIQCVTGKELAADQHPTHHGIVMHNAGTAFASFEAIVEGKPCISRITTLCGEALQTPKNFDTLIGTPVDYLFALCGIQRDTPRRSIIGGALMGSELASSSAAVCKTTNCIIAPGADELQVQALEQACIRCGFCADVCPVKLLPQQLLAYSKTQNTPQLLDHGLLDCIECGACDYACPSNIPLVSIYKESKKSVQTRAQNLERSEYWQQRFQFRQYRIKKEKDEAPSRKAKAAPQAEQAAISEQKTPDIISKEQASLDIAAAVARVKARREEQNK